VIGDAVATFRSCRERRRRAPSSSAVVDNSTRTLYRQLQAVAIRRSTNRSVCLLSMMVVTAGAGSCRRPAPPPPVERASDARAAPPREQRIESGSVGTAEEITKGIRRQLRGIKTRCDEGPPSPESRAEWKRMAKPRELGTVPVSALEKRSDHDLVSEIYSRLLDKLYTVGLVGMTRPEQNVYFILTLQAEVVNGGFQLYFANSSGNCALRTQAALREADGFAAWAAVFHRALEKFPDGLPSEDRAERGDEMQALDDEFAIWGQVDDAFFKLDSSDVLLARYIRGRIDAFAKPAPRL